MPRPKVRTYGKKKCIDAACTIFGEESPSLISSSGTVRDPLSDVTSQLSKLNVQHEEVDNDEDDWLPSNGSEVTGQHHQVNSESQGQSHKRSIDASDQSSTRAIYDGSVAYTASSDDSSIKELSLDDIVLKPLTETYKKDRGYSLRITNWDDLIPQGADVEKIAEASFAEVYRVSIDGQSSILKLMQLKIPSDPLSATSKSAIEVETVVSEIRLMNALTEHPGFVTFKEAHLVRGKPCPAIIRAYCNCRKWSPANGTSEFPNPQFFLPNALFLVIELGDAGIVLDDVPVQNIHQLWDIFIGVIISLGCAELWFKFEHRDLHESNICIKFGEPKPIDGENPSQKYGLSGIRTTIIDYGLSRATLQNDDRVYYDMDSDLAIFHGSPGHTQFDTYRRMRSHLFTGERKMHPKAWHDEQSKAWNEGHTWREYIPYTNVLWIKYLLGYLKKNFRDSGGNLEDLRRFEKDTTELKRRLDPRTLVKNGAFTSAIDVSIYVQDMEWITDTQITELD
ncbi:Serine threonine-kinase haspin [Hyphodiscus hymeniophilus]|uniref:non-specific serine/threonine protein kinase n=1 Tax=Hyphodiscus hymeniophilus TaxID=353542 RepID=A0A9P6VGG1_9HELO|nr:Serine threonine-kinase haspin [Hyphodiscus hymeniophilus]